MTISKTKADGKLTVSLDGRLDTITAPSLDAELSNLEGVKELVIDMKDLQFISSAGLRVLLRAQENMSRKGTMEVHNANDDVLEIFNVTGFSDFLTIR